MLVDTTKHCTWGDDGGMVRTCSYGEDNDKELKEMYKA